MKTLLRSFRWFGKERSAELKFICSDMWNPYLRVIAKKSRRHHPRARPLPHHGQDEQGDR